MLGLFKILKTPVSTLHDTDKGVESVPDTPWEKWVRSSNKKNIGLKCIDNN